MSDKPMAIHRDVIVILGITEQLVGKGYVLGMTIRDGDVELTYMFAGDSSCPHKKYFDPSDGHGSTTVYADDFICEENDELNDPVMIAQRMVDYCERVEGTPINHERL